MALLHWSPENSRKMLRRPHFTWRMSFLCLGCGFCHRPRNGLLDLMSPSVPIDCHRRSFLNLSLFFENNLAPVDLASQVVWETKRGPRTKYSVKRTMKDTHKGCRAREIMALGAKNGIYTSFDETGKDTNPIPHAFPNDATSTEVYVAFFFFLVALAPASHLSKHWLVRSTCIGLPRPWR